MASLPTRVLQLGGVFSIALLLNACGSASPVPSAAATPSSNLTAGAGGGVAPSTAAQGTKIKRGGTFTASATTSFAGSDPAMGQNAYQSWPYVGTYILRRHSDSWKIEGDAVEKWEYSPDGMELTLHVRPGVKWQNKPPVNGRDIEARDIVYSIRSIAGLQYSDMAQLRFPRRANLEDMEDAFVVDKSTVKIKLKHPSATILEGLGEHRGPITPDQAREFFGSRESLANPSPDTHLSAGPFTLTKFQDLQEAIYTRYPDYWEKGEDGQSKPYLDQIRHIWIQDTGTQIAAFIAGQTDMIGMSSPESRKQVMDSRPDTQALAAPPFSNWYHMTFNTTRKPFDDIRVRKAMAMVIDQKEIGQTLWGEFNGQPLWRYNGALGWVYPQAIPQEELAKMKYFESPKSQATIDEARKLMAEAGVDKLELEAITNTGSIGDVAMLTASQIKRVFPNINIKVLPLDNAIQLERAAKGDFDIQSYLYMAEPTAVAMLKTVYHSKGGRNSSRTKDAKIDELLDKAAIELDETKRNQLLRDVQLRALELYTAWPVSHLATVTGFRSYMRGVELGAGTQYNMWAKNWWFDK